jgi:hypothetical protein
MSASISEVKPKQKRTHHRPIPKQRLPFDPEVFYQVSDITNRKNPHFLCALSTLYGWFSRGLLVPNRVGKKVYIKGSAILALLNGEQEKAA